MAYRVHVIGAGLAGLSAAAYATDKADTVAVYEAAGHAGGRCRSFYDEILGCRIDNGNHLLLSGNHAAIDYLTHIGSKNALVGPAEAEFPFLDLRNDTRWVVKPDKWIIPWSLFSAKGRVPGTAFGEYVRGLSLARTTPDQTIAQCLDKGGVLFEKFWEPLAVSVLNTEADAASARLLWPVLRETFGRGAYACIPLIVREGLSEAFVDPALAFLEQKNGSVAFNQRLRRIEFTGDHVSALNFGEDTVRVDEQDSVILATPPSVASALVPGLQTPDEFRPIVNGHFILPSEAPQMSFLGLVGGVAHWLFVRGKVASITVSAATELAAQDSDMIAQRLWLDICRALELGDAPLGPYRIVKEKRATFAQTPVQSGRRPQQKTGWKNLFLAGDWVDTGLPATIEGTIRSGRKAAKLTKR